MMEIQIAMMDETHYVMSKLGGLEAVAHLQALIVVQKVVEIL